jgi:uncharacterized protein (TIGR02266 family)
MLSVDVELNRAESELQQDESALHTELARLVAVGAEVEARLEALRGAVAAAGAQGVRDAGLEGRLKAARAPQLDAEAPFREARAAREVAVQTRRATNAAARQQAAALKQQLAALATQVQADEKAALRLTGLAKQKQREDEQTASDETLRPGAVAAVRLEQPPAPPPMAFSLSQVPAKAKPIGRMRAPPPPGKPAQRISPRVAMQAVVDLNSDDNFFNGFSSNISDGGLFVATVDLKPIGTEVDLSFSLPSGERVAAHGVVRWVREIDDKHPESFPGLGIQFTRLTEPAQQAIGHFVESREPMFYVE